MGDTGRPYPAHDARKHSVGGGSHQAAVQDTGWSAVRQRLCRRFENPRMAKEKPTAHLGPIDGRSDLVDQPGDEQPRPAQADACIDVGGACGVVNADSGWVNKTDREAVHRAADVFVDVAYVADVPLPVSQCAVPTAVFGDGAT